MHLLRTPALVSLPFAISLGCWRCFISSFLWCQVLCIVDTATQRNRHGATNDMKKLSCALRARQRIISMPNNVWKAHTNCLTSSHKWDKERIRQQRQTWIQSSHPVVIEIVLKDRPYTKWLRKQKKRPPRKSPFAGKWKVRVECHESFAAHANNAVSTQHNYERDPIIINFFRSSFFSSLPAGARVFAEWSRLVMNQRNLIIFSFIFFWLFLLRASQ